MIKIGKLTTVDSTAIIGKNCDIDDFVSIRKRAIIGDNVTLKCRATIGLDCKVGHNCFIGAHAILLNGNENEYSTPSEIGDNVLLGACACILPGVKVCSDVVIGAGSVVTKDINKPGVYVGNPCKKI